MKRPGVPVRRKRPRRISARREAEREALQAFRTAVSLRAGGWCEVASPACPPGRHAGTEAHHVVSRARAPRWVGLHDPANGLWVCRAAHEHLENHPAWATERGYLRSAPPPSSAIRV